MNAIVNKLLLGEVDLHTLVSGINLLRRLLIFKKISTQGMLIPVTPFVYF